MTRRKGSALSRDNEELDDLQRLLFPAPDALESEKGRKVWSQNSRRDEERGEKRKGGPKLTPSKP